MKETLKDKLIRLSEDLAVDVYKLVATYPKFERYGLVSQLQRGVVSVGANIVEGVARKSEKEMRRFLNIAYASLSEVKFMLRFSKRVNYCSEENFNSVYEKADRISALLWSFMRNLDE
ncbi:MAG: four helix bundle protein [Patescibacteria group bacterium]|nr:four helix bundle protein [Patescibacteria group bacterium]